MKCPFCQEEIEPVETASENIVKCHCPKCQSLVAAYREGMEGILKNLVSIERFEGGKK